MTLVVSLKSTDLAALLCSRICHDLISPIGAIQNAMELYDEGGADEDALRLVRLSVANASARLQFARLAFGSAGGVEDKIDTDFAKQVSQQYMKEKKAILKWQASSFFLPKDEVKLLLNLLLITNTIVSHSGEISVIILQDTYKRVFRFEVCGKILRTPSHFIELYSGKISEELIDARVVQLYYTILLAEITAMKISIHETSDCIILESVKKL
ncbi:MULTISPECIES: histidine phosphotransferase ChpT [unclassified Bartonella]|uniref:histidine phosphotransferase ChpT n=1 Tax=unclassified Bartonella TaxID=2645622 RepID=UPI00099A621A|nr:MULTISPECIES: histidine phosphotransferase family protein [unclassified Bartonella]AQX27576.1 histidine phosphotransferase ChpT [Bartonella sp. JB15]AQX28855.1 histidine phosphotransferase ChpT [Bartonella sp. JB63]